MLDTIISTIPAFMVLILYIMVWALFCELFRQRLGEHDIIGTIMSLVMLLLLISVAPWVFSAVI